MPVDEQDQEEQQRRRYQQALAENGQNPYEGEGPQQEVRSADNSPNNGAPPPPVPSGEGQAPYEGEGPPAQQPQPPSTPKQPRSAQYMEGINQALGSPPIPPKNNALQTIGRTILQMNPRLAPHADEILHPKFSAEQRQYGARMNDYAERQKLAENQLRNDSLADQREATAQYRKLTAQNAADQRKEQRFQHDTEILYRGGQLIPVDAPVPQGFSVIPAPFSPGMQYAIKPNASTEDVELTPELARFGKLAPGTRVSHDLYLKLVTAAAQSQGRVDAINAKPIPPPRLSAAEAQFKTAQDAYRALTSMDPVQSAAAQAWLNRNMGTPLGSQKVTNPETGSQSVVTVPRSAPPAGVGAPVSRGQAPIPQQPVRPQDIIPPRQGSNPRARLASWSDIENQAGTTGGNLGQQGFSLVAAQSPKVQSLPSQSQGTIALSSSAPRALAREATLSNMTTMLGKDMESGKYSVTDAMNRILQNTPNKYQRASLYRDWTQYMMANGILNTLSEPLDSSTRTMRQTARTLLPAVDRIKSEIQALGDQNLGPLSGRLNEFLAGTVGAGDPKYAALRADLGLFMTGMMRAHVGARGGTGLMSHFHGLWDGGKMNAASLQSSLDTAKQWLTGYANEGKPINPQPGTNGLKNLSTEQLFQMLTKGK